jgi:hypothetical protein
MYLILDGAVDILIVPYKGQYGLGGGGGGGRVRKVTITYSLPPALIRAPRHINNRNINSYYEGHNPLSGHSNLA